MNIFIIKSVFETSNTEVVNDLLKQDWILLNTYVKDGEAFYCLGKKQSNKKIASFDDSEAIKNRKTRLEKIRSLAEAINKYQKDSYEFLISFNKWNP